MCALNILNCENSVTRIATITITLPETKHIQVTTLVVVQCSSGFVNRGYFMSVKLFRGFHEARSREIVKI